MCEYCENGKPILDIEENIASYIWDTLTVDKVNSIIFIRGNYLCIGDKNDCNCIDHTEYSKINYCFNCGKKLNAL